jgi:predicted benzoate:H+ symporter BenE
MVPFPDETTVLLLSLIFGLLCGVVVGTLWLVRLVPPQDRNATVAGVLFHAVTAGLSACGVGWRLCPVRLDSRNRHPGTIPNGGEPAPSRYPVP